MEEFYETVPEALEKFKDSRNLIIGDLNARLGKTIENSKIKIGNSGYAYRTKSG